MSIFQRTKFALSAFKSYGASFATDGHQTINLLSSETKELKKLLDAINGEYSHKNLLFLFHEVAEIFIPVHAIASTVADGVVQLKRTSNDEVVYDNKDFNRLMSQPNPLQNLRELIYEWVVYEIITGKNFLYANVPDTLSFDYKNIATLINLWADKVTPEIDAQPKILSATTITDLIKYYKVEGYSKPISPDKVLYTRRINLKSDDFKLKGKSPLRSADKAIANILAVYAARHAIYVSRGALGFIVSKKSDASGNVALTSNEKKQLLDEQQKMYGLKKGKYPYGISDAPLDFVRLALSIQELEPFKETQASALAIAGVLGVDKDLLPLADASNSTWENKKASLRQLYQTVSIPLAKKICESLTNFLKLDKAGYWIDVSFDHVEVLQENKKEKSDVFKNNVDSYTKMYEKGVITKNQFLIGCGFEAIPNGDVYITDIKNDTPLAVRLGVGGTQALQSVLADNNLTEDQKKNVLMIVFGLPEDQANAMSIGNGANANNNGNQNSNSNNTNNDAQAA